MIKGLKKWRLFSLLAVFAVFLAGCGQEQLSTFHPAGQVAKDQFNLLLLSSGIMLLVIIVVVAIYLVALVRFRRSKLGEDFVPEQVEGSHTLEMVWTFIPIVLILILAVPTVYYTYKLGDVKAMEAVDEDGNAENLVIDVTAKLYWWEFEYPDLGIVTAQELVVPTDEKVYFNLIAADVKHSFWIPAVGGKLDTNVENVNKFYLSFEKESEGLKDGVFYGKCAELCGPSHALMDFKVKTLPRDQFDDWVAGMQKTADEPVVANADGEAVFSQSCIGCHAVSGVGESGAQGPNLATFGDRNRVAGFLKHDEKELKDWIRDTQKHKPGNQMPSFGKDQISDEDLDALSEYLLGLKVEK
ncbi:MULTISPECIES: cytochrome c oxidase subunit II [Sporosarcina]|uniref:cytochrome c oxidase subunit II n=1 Tax=Sporosarcina TaxID=1569 RepID=UPI00129A2854|nr:MULTISPECIES: cytochrome c oxidase subunit II [Sporosarcina]GKV64315.1 cytochrome c oxidase subunit 2 [Sporosarcina sp. NCCP-2331]GLB54221.1 cytochrome c oxidase subunit 2 [Sporosarcina sp. NCCP-2378]